MNGSVSIAAIVPALDESATIAGVVERLRRRADTVIVVDNGSADATSSVAANAGAVVVSEPQRGYGAACLAAIAWIPRHADVVLFADADGSDDLDAIDELVVPITTNRADLVIGSRVRLAAPGALTIPQRAGNWLASRILERWYGLPTTDLGPFRAIRASALRDLGMRDRGFGWTVEMQARAALAGLRVVEVDVAYHRRRAGRSKIAGTVRGSARAGAAILWRLYAVRRCP
ncbi:MAG: glycosyltransferase family 2 protein [Myxococcota bacterium]|nr:glycosyltransferase family 2 protein [Deltaproteobacteria bacterium]MDQ3335713.1 glycosyltransferase family 2 protein [Myxococcota bacterium]